MADDARVALWDAINEYATACGGSPATTGIPRMNAVTAVERALESYRPYRPPSGADWEEARSHLAGMAAKLRQAGGPDTADRLMLAIALADGRAKLAAVGKQIDAIRTESEADPEAEIAVGCYCDLEDDRIGRCVWCALRRVLGEIA